MFGNISAWGQNNQQQQPATGAFGQPAANPLGAATNPSGSAFGQSTAFGQPQQPASQVNPMFGNLSTPAPAGNTYGAFGSTPAATTSAFAPKPATGFGAFSGGTGSVFGGGATPQQQTGAFGQPLNTATTTPASTGIFGSSASTASTSAFGGGGAGTGLFGSKPSVFGAAASTTSTPQTITTGTSNPPYAAHTTKEDNSTFHYQSISCIPAYQGYSFEELRVQDYAQGRKTAGAAPAGGAFGSAFGAAQPAAPATTGLFGQPAQPAQPATSVFGSTGAFGQSQNTAQPAAQTTGLFGSTFGQPAQQPATQNAFGGALNQPQQQQTTGLFGGGGAFGQNAAKPAGGLFGSTPATTTTNTLGGGGLFGQTQQQQPAQTGGLFGNQQQQPATTGLFGGGGAFGQAAKPAGGLFGATATTTPALGQQQQPQQQTGGLFGGGGGLFGNAQNQQQQQPAATGGLFGSTATPAATTNTGGLFGGGGGLFGNAQNQQQQQQPATGGLFGAKPATTTGTGLFGNTAIGQQAQTNPQQQTGGGLFGLGQNNQQQQSTLGGGGLFGAKPLGSTPSTGGGLFGSTFGGSAANTSQPAAPAQTLTASINQPIGANLPIFNMLPPGPRLVDLEATQPKKKAPFFTDLPNRSTVPRPSSTYNPPSSKLRGFGSVSGFNNPDGNPFASSTNLNNVSFMNGKPGVLAIGDGRAGSVGPDSFLGRSGSPALGSGSRSSVKKVILDKKIEPIHLFKKTGTPGIAGSKVTFSPALSAAAREADNATALRQQQQQIDSPTPVPRSQQRPAVKDSAEVSSDPSKLQEGDYYVKPDLASLKRLGYDELSHFKGLIVGRVGYGEVEFLEPVDLTGLAKLSALVGDVIHFDPKECSVYPDMEEVDKPPPGHGLNVRARLTLDKCWAVDKATREPLKDPKHPSVVKHMKRLRNIKETHFESFDMESGKWTFTVDHF